MFMEERVHPIPFRTRQLSSPSSMILRILTWESRTTPRLYFQKPFRFARKGFCFAQNSAQRPCDEPLLNPRTSLLSLKKAPPLLKCSPLANPLPLAFFNQTGIPLPHPCSGLPFKIESLRHTLSCIVASLILDGIRHGRTIPAFQ